MAEKTTVPTKPTAAAPAMPSMLRGAVQRAGSRLASGAATSTTSACTASRATPGESRRDTTRKTTTTAPVKAPNRAPLAVTLRKSERSVRTGAALADILLRSSEEGWWR